MTETGLLLLSWWLTAWVHGGLMLLLVYLGERLALLKAPSLREAAWRLALLAPLLTASVQTLIVDHPWAGRVVLAVSSDSQAAAPELRPDSPSSGGRLQQASAAMSTGAGGPSDVATGSELDSTEQALRTPSARSWGAASVAASVGWIWSLFALLMLLRMGWQWRREHRRSGLLADLDEADVVAETRALQRLAGLPPIRLALDPELASPVSLPPALICLPPWALSQLHGAQRRAMLAHEVAHLRRRDSYWQCACVLVSQVLPQPLGALARRRLAELAEFACDAWAAQRSGGGRALAESLAACAAYGYAGRKPSIFAAAMAEPRSILIERVYRLTKEQAMGFEPLSVVRQSALVLALLAACVALPGVGLRDAIAAPALSEVPEPPPPPTAPKPPAPPAVPATPIAPVAQIPEPPTPPAPPVAPAPPAPPVVGAVALSKAPTPPTPPTPPSAPVAPAAPTPPAGRAPEAPEAPVAPVAPVAPAAPVAPTAPAPPSEDRVKVRASQVSALPALRKLIEPDIFESHFITDPVGEDC